VKSFTTISADLEGFEKQYSSLDPEGFNAFQPQKLLILPPLHNFMIRHKLFKIFSSTLFNHSFDDIKN